MKNVLNPIIIALGIVSTLIWGQYILEQSFFIIMLFCMFFIGILSIVIRPLFSFSLLISFILALGFLNIGLSWNKHLGIIPQGMNIQIQMIYTLGGILAWICGYSIQKYASEFHHLHNEVKRLQKIEDNTGFLTYNEFLTEAKLLFTGLQRRKEEGFLVKIHFSEEVDFKVKVIKEKVVKLIMQSIRAEYDLACYLNGTGFLIFLNNTNQNGVEIVIERFYQHLKEEKNLDKSLFQIEKQPVLDNWNATQSFIDAWRMEGKSA